MFSNLFNNFKNLFNGSSRRESSTSDDSNSNRNQFPNQQFDSSNSKNESDIKFNEGHQLQPLFKMKSKLNVNELYSNFIKQNKLNENDLKVLSMFMNNVFNKDIKLNTYFSVKDRTEVFVFISSFIKYTILNNELIKMSNLNNDNFYIEDQLINPNHLINHKIISVGIELNDMNEFKLMTLSTENAIIKMEDCIMGLLIKSDNDQSATNWVQLNKLVELINHMFDTTFKLIKIGELNEMLRQLIEISNLMIQIDPTIIVPAAMLIVQLVKQKCIPHEIKSTKQSDIIMNQLDLNNVIKLNLNSFLVTHLKHCAIKFSELSKSKLIKMQDECNSTINHDSSTTQTSHDKLNLMNQPKHPMENERSQEVIDADGSDEATMNDTNSLIMNDQHHHQSLTLDEYMDDDNQNGFGPVLIMDENIEFEDDCDNHAVDNGSNQSLVGDYVNSISKIINPNETNKPDSIIDQLNEVIEVEMQPVNDQSSSVQNEFESRFDMIDMFDSKTNEKNMKSEMKKLHKGHNITNPSCTDALRMKFVDSIKSKLIPCDYEFSQMDTIKLNRVKGQRRERYDELKMKLNLNEDELDYILLCRMKLNNDKTFKVIKVDIDSLIKTAKESNCCDKLIDLLCDQMLLLLLFKLEDPQIRKIENSFNEVDTCICIDGVQRPFFNIRDYNNSIATCMKMCNEPKLIEIKGERYPLFDGIDMNLHFKGEMKKSDEDPAKQSLQSLFNRCERIINNKKLQTMEINDGFGDPTSIVSKIKSKSNEMFDRTGHFQFKEIEVYKPLLNTLQLANLITTLLMIDESIHEIDSMLRLLRTVNTIEYAHHNYYKTYYDSDKQYVDEETLIDEDELDDYVDLSKHKNNSIYIDPTGNIMSQDGPTMVKGSVLRSKLWESEVEGQRMLEVLKSISKENNFSYSKVYGNFKITVVAVKKHKTAGERKFHFVIEMKNPDGTIQCSKVHLINMEKINNDIKNFRTLMHLRNTIEIRSVTYKMFDLYCRHPNQVKADMICSIEFATKHREGQLFSWKLLSKKFKSMELKPHNSSDIEMAFWCFISSLDECVHDQFAFSLFHAPNRQSPKEMISCYDAVLRETPIGDRFNSTLFQAFINDLRTNLKDYFDVDRLKTVMNQPDSIDVNMYLSTASSTNVCLPSNYNCDNVHLLMGHVVKDFKFKVFDEALENSLSNLKLSQIMDMCAETIPVCSLTSKMNVKSVREIYVFDPITSIAASAESHIAQKISDCSHSDVIMKETKKGEIISDFIDQSLERIKNNQSANIIVIEGDGKKFNQHMILECFNEMYKAINDVINDSIDSDWCNYMNYFYSYYQRKQIVVKMKSYVECFCFHLIKLLCYHDVSKIEEITPMFNNIMEVCGKMFEKSSCFRIASKDLIKSDFRSFNSKIQSNSLSKHEIELVNNCHDGTQVKLLSKLCYCKSINKLNEQYEQLINSEFLSKYIKNLMILCYNSICNEFKAVQLKNDPNKTPKSLLEFTTDKNSIKNEVLRRELMTIIVKTIKKLKSSDLVIPTPFGMAQGILACSSSVFSSSILRFTCKKLLDEGWFDSFECVATSDDLMVIATTSREMTIEMQKEIKIRFGTMMSELGVPMNAIKTSVKINPGRISFNSVLYDCCNRKRSDYIVTTSRKLPCVTRIMKNIYSTTIDDHCALYNSVSTALKELFSTFKFSQKERVMIVNNGRSIYARTEFVDYYHQDASAIQKEFSQAWPSSKESLNANSDYALFNRKEMDLLWFIRNHYYLSKYNLNKSINMGLLANTKGERFQNNKLDFKTLNSNQFLVSVHMNDVLIIEVSTNVCVAINPNKLFVQNENGNYKLRTKEANLEWLMIELNIDEARELIDLNKIKKSTFIGKFVNLVDINVLRAHSNGMSKEEFDAIKSCIVSPQDATNIYYLFLKWFGNNLEVTSDPIGFRIKMKHFDKNVKLLDIMSRIDEMKTCNVQNVMNLFSHLGENYREQLPHNLILKVQGTPHIPTSTIKFNYTFNNFDPIDDQNRWKIPMTMLTQQLLFLHPFKYFNYAFSTDDTSSSAINDINPNLQLMSIEFNWEWKSQLLSACLMMDYDKMYYRSEARQLLNGSIVPFVPNLTHNGCYGLPKVDETIGEFLKRCSTRFDPWILCQKRRQSGVYTDHGILDDVPSNRLYYLNHHKIVWCCDRSTLIKKTVNFQSLPSCIKNYEVDISVNVKDTIDAYKFDVNGKWTLYGKQCKSGKSRSLPMFNSMHYSEMSCLDETQRGLCFKYNKKNVRTDETKIDKLRKLWLLN